MSPTGDVGKRTSRLGRYELITRIGEGGMAEVQLALQRGPAGFEKLVVVKLVHQSLAAQKDFVDMLLDEARVAALLKHPNVVDIYDLGQAEGRFFIAMEYLEGEPLLAVLRAGREGKRLDILSTGRLIADTAEGLDAAHELRTMGGEPLELVHHDISLGNIVVLYNGQVKLVDFGVAKASQSVSQNRRVQGKFSYMAPEKLRGAAGDRRSDIWSLGCVLWESLTLKRLFKGGNDNDTMRQVLESEVPVPSQINGDVLPAFDPIVMRSLQRDPDARYPTAKEMATDLEEVLRKEGYGGKNDRIAKYMQATFKAHIDARKQLLQEVSSKGRASADVLEAAFDDPLLAAGSPVGPNTGDFSVRFKPNTIEVRPPTPRPGRPDSTLPAERGRPGSTPPLHRLAPFPQLAAVPPQNIQYPRAIPSDLPPVAQPDDEDVGPTVLSAPLDEDELAREAGSDVALAVALPGQPLPEGTGVRVAPRSQRGLYLGVAAAAALAVVVVVAILLSGGGGDGDRTAQGGGDPGDSGAVAAVTPDAPEAPADAPERADDAEPPGDAGIASTAPADAADEIEIAPDLTKPKKPNPSALYKSGLNAYVVGDLKTALANFQRAIAANPGFAMAWRGAGMVYERQGDTRSATAAFQRYLQLAPNASDAATIRGKLGGPK